MNRRNFLKRLAGAFTGLALVEAFHLDWLRRQRESVVRYGLDFSSGDDYSAVVVLDRDGEVLEFAHSVDEQHWAEVMEWYQHVVALNFGVDPTWL